VGSLAFYNTAGQPVIGGNLSDLPIAAYTEGSATVRAGDTKATLYAYTPVNGESPGQWSGEALSASTVFPNAAAPGSLGTTSLPVVTGASVESLSTYISDFPNTDTTSDGYAGLYVLRLKTSAPGKPSNTTYDSAVIQVTGSTWAEVSPVPSLLSTSTTLSVKQTSPQPSGASVELDSASTPGVAGQVQFENGSTPIGSPVTVANDGTASVTTSSLPSGDLTLNAVFTPSSFLGYASSTGTTSFTILPPNLTLTPTPTITGTAATGATLTAVPGTWDSGVTLSYQWNNNGNPISGATSSTYVVQPADDGQSITVTVTGTKSGYNSASETSAPVTPGSGTLTLTPTPTITGTAATGATLTAVPGTWDSGVTLNYQWNNDGNPISGATSLTYVLKAADVGQPITVTVTGNKPDYGTVQETSSAVTPVAGTLTLTPTPTITGTATVGATLTAVPGTWDSGVTLSYQWSSDGTPISGATSSTYVVQSTDTGASLSVSVTGALAGYTSVTKTSSEVAVLGTISPTSTPTITGSAVVGDTLTAHLGTWKAGVSFAYQWNRDGSAIAGAISSTYTLVGADVGLPITVTVTGSKAGYAPAVRTSTSVTPTAAPLPVIGTATITGSAITGGTLGVKTPGWTSGVTFTYQWLRDGTAISGATSSTYTLVVADFGHQITVRAKGSKVGYKSASATSAAVTVGPGTQTVTGTPTVSGTNSTGGELSANPGIWSTGETFKYHWLRNGAVITGATQSTYTVVAADVGQSIQVKVTGILTGYTNKAASSEPVVPVKGTQVLHPVPTITGSTTLKSVLTAHAGTWDVGVTKKFQWYRDGVAITGATTSTYTIVKADQSHALTVTVTGTKPGYVKVSETSLSTPIPSAL
jgi:hypothetical protein